MAGHRPLKAQIEVQIFALELATIVVARQNVDGDVRMNIMTFAYVNRTTATLAVNDRVLAWVSADGHGRNYASLTAGLTTSANLPTVGSITSVQVDDPAGDLSYSGDGAGGLTTVTTGAAAAGQGPIHVKFVSAAADLVNAPSVVAPWFDQSTVIVCATG